MVKIYIGPKGCQLLSLRRFPLLLVNVLSIVTSCVICGRCHYCNPTHNLTLQKTYRFLEKFFSHMRSCHMILIAVTSLESNFVEIKCPCGTLCKGTMALATSNMDSTPTRWKKSKILLLTKMCNHVIPCMYHKIQSLAIVKNKYSF